MSGTRTGGAIYTSEITAGRTRRVRPVLGTVAEPAREIPVLHDTDVLVVGGGPAGTTAAIAAARLGARVLLAERSNHLGGLSTGGLVIWIDRMTDWDGNLVIRGLGEELLDRLPKDAIHGPDRSDWGSRAEAAVAHWKPRFSAHHDTVTWAPMIDPEQLKSVSLAALREAGVDLLFHAWASAAVAPDGRMQGVIFEGKQGRFAVTAQVVIDTTGDGDIFAGAGEQAAMDVEEASFHHCANTSWLWGGVDVAAWMAFRTSPALAAFSSAQRAALGFMQLPMPAWRDDVVVFMGPRFAGYDCLDSFELTEVELRSHDAARALLDFYRAHAPGFERAWLMLTAPQIGVRQTRRLVGRTILTRQHWQSGVRHADEVGVSPSLGPNFDSVSVPYGSLLPRRVRGLLVAGRHLSSDASSQTFMREIPQCWLTGQAAGAAAALAADAGVDPGDVPIATLQAKLAGQGAFLRAPQPVEA
jgi:hypothetical protein